VRASRTSSSLNGLMIAITIFIGLVPPRRLVVLPAAIKRRAKS
jgi:hypothetical protein